MAMECIHACNFFVVLPRTLFARLQQVSDAASVARKKKEKKLEAEITVFAQNEKEIKERKAAIDAASVARKKKEKELDEQITVFVRKEKK